MTSEENKVKYMTRKEIRERTMQLIFQMDANGSFDPADLSPVIEDADVVGYEQAMKTLNILHDHIYEIDGIISENLTRWTIHRIPKAELAILRLAVCEMLFMDDEDVPDAVAINEAVELAKEYGEEKSPAFINSVLGKIVRSKA